MARWLIDEAWRKGTHGKYKAVYKKWLDYQSKNIGRQTAPQINDIINFLSHMYEGGLKYSTIKGHLSALKHYVQVKGLQNWSRHPKILRFMKGVFNNRQPLPRYTSIWNVNQVLTHLKLMTQVDEMSVVRKLVVLFMILSGTRVNTLDHIRMTGMYVTEEEVTFVIKDPLKHSRPGYNNEPLTFRAFPDMPELCPVNTLRSYLAYRLSEDTQLSLDEDGTDFLLITTMKPRRKATPDTIKRWIKTTLHEAGIDTGRFTPHSCRGASTSAASIHSVPLSLIMKSANWSQKSTFIRHYQKEIDEIENKEKNYGTELLKGLRKGH